MLPDAEKNPYFYKINIIRTGIGNFQIQGRHPDVDLSSHHLHREIQKTGPICAQRVEWIQVHPFPTRLNQKADDIMFYVVFYMDTNLTWANL